MAPRRSTRSCSSVSYQEEEEEEEEEKEKVVTAVEEESSFPIGSHVRKFFEGYGWFHGTVESFSNDLYRVVYEDGDNEDCNHEELKCILVAKTEERTAMEKDSDDDDDDNDDDNVYKEEEDQDGKGEESAADMDLSDVDAQEEEEPLLEPTPTTSPALQTPKKMRTKKWKQAPVVTPDVSVSARSVHSKDKLSPASAALRSIAIQGLPRGALGRCKHNGFTIRTLDGIPPQTLLSSSFWMGTTRLNTKTNSSKPMEMRSHLPGRLLVVSLDRDGVCPPHLLGQTFESASDLHGALKQEWATYEMEAVADPSFASWEFIKDRLASSGLEDIKSGNGPYLVEIEWDGDCQISSHVRWYKDYSSSGKTAESLQWAIIEGNGGRDVPPVLLGVPSSLVECRLDENERDVESVEDVTDFSGSSQDLLPPLSKTAAQIRLPASLLQKAMRRGYGMCSPAPLLEACASLLLPKNATPGSTLAMLKTVWGCMLVDASPFEDTSDCLGLPSLLLLSLVAKADPNWILPKSLRGAAVAAALRTATSAPSQPWIGHVCNDDFWWNIEKVGTSSELSNERTPSDIRNILRITQSACGGRMFWGKWGKFTGDTPAAAVLAYVNTDGWDGCNLDGSPLPLSNEVSLLSNWEDGITPSIPNEPIVRSLDAECRLAAIEPSVIPHSLVLLQAILKFPPTSWKKHGLPSLAKQIRKLISEANPRIRQRMQLARLATWGKEQVDLSTILSQQSESKNVRYASFREIVTPTATLSESETEVVDCFEAIQQDFRNYSKACIDSEALHFPSSRRVRAGPPPTAFEGRLAFLLVFAKAIEVEVCPNPDEPGIKEVVSAMFCGDPFEPLLVQRIGKAREEGKELATAGGSTSGATAVPSLGYVQRSRSDAERKLMEAAEIAVAAYWEKGVSEPLPTPPQGFQWELSGQQKVSEEHEGNIVRTITFQDNARDGRKTWCFSVEGLGVKPFDAREVISPCKLDLNCHQPVPLEPGSARAKCLRIALYLNHENTDEVPAHGDNVLKAMSELHNLAVSDRSEVCDGPSEGLVYDWIPLARVSPIPSRTFRDALLAIRTRERDHVLLGKGIQSDGTGAPRDMTEGVLLRLFHALEMLYPTALKKDSAFKFRVRPRGAAFHHMMVCLEHLGRGEKPALGMKADNESIGEVDMKPDGQKRGRAAKAEESISRVKKRPRREAATKASAATAAQAKAENGSTEGDDHDDACWDRKREELRPQDYLPLPQITTPLWAHQQASVSKVVQGVREGKRGHADASAVGAGKTLTALATIANLAQWIEQSGKARHGVLVMLPTKSLVKEWLLEIACHTKGFHVVEQREDGTLFSMTYAKMHPPIDGNTLVISTLDRVCRHPFVRQCAWDFVVIDECLSVQNAAAKRNPSAWRQIEVSMCGVLMLSATFFRSKYESLFYMIRMLRTPLPRTMEWLPATIHEHIVCQVPETDRTWKMEAEMVPLEPNDLQQYRNRIDRFRRQQINNPKEVDGRKLWIELESFLRSTYEGRTDRLTYKKTSVMAEAFVRRAKKLLKQGCRPLVFADTSHEAEFLLNVFRGEGLDARTWANIASDRLKSSLKGVDRVSKNRVIVAVKSTEGQGINMQHHADSILCRPTPGDHLEQMKGRIDRPGQKVKDLLLVVVTAEHTIEEAKFANIRLAGSFFRERIAPVATKYREKIDLEAVLAVQGNKKLKRGTVCGAWWGELEKAGQSGAFAAVDKVENCGGNGDSMDVVENTNDASDDVVIAKSAKESEEPKYKPLNKVIRNKGDPAAVKQAKALAKKGQASLAVRCWLYPEKVKKQPSSRGKVKALPMISMERFSDKTPPIVLEGDTVRKAVVHLSKNDPKLAALIARVGTDALVHDYGQTAKPPTQARLFDKCLRSITFTMVSVDAGCAFLRRLAIKVGVCLESQPAARQRKILKQFLKDMNESGYMKNVTDPRYLLYLLLQGDFDQITFTHHLLRELVDCCEVIKGKRTGYPHLCGVSHPCGKNDDPADFLAKAREHANGGGAPVSAGFSSPKAGFIVDLVNDFECGKISGEKIVKASDREAAKMLIGLKGIGDWCAGGILMHFLNRSDILLYGDLTIRNYLNDLYDINHEDSSETLVESAADFPDNATNRNLIDEVAKKNGWAPYRSVVCFLMYHLQEENLVLL